MMHVNTYRRQTGPRAARSRYSAALYMKTPTGLRREPIRNRFRSGAGRSLRVSDDGITTTVTDAAGLNSRRRVRGSRYPLR
jgi:hypothetical protein